MDRKTQKKFRILVPGVLSLVTILSLISPSNFLVAIEGNDLLKFSVGGVVASVIAIAVGFVYDAVKVRYRLLGDPFFEVVGNINKAMLKMIESSVSLNECQRKYLKAGKRLMNIFYTTVDKNETLKSRKLGVRVHGLAVTSAMDLSILSTLGAILHYVALVANGPQVHFNWFIGYILVFFVAQLFFYPITLANHKGSSNEQLEYIRDFCRNEVQEEANAVLSSMPKAKPAKD